MIIPIGSTGPLTIGPFLSSSGLVVTSGTPSIKLFVNGVKTAPAGSAAAVDGTYGTSKFTPASADTFTAGELIIVATLSGAVAWSRDYQVGPAPLPATGAMPDGESSSLILQRVQSIDARFTDIDNLGPSFGRCSTTPARKPSP